MAGGPAGKPDLEGAPQAVRHQEALGQSCQHDPGAASHGGPHQPRSRLNDTISLDSIGMGLRELLCHFLMYCQNSVHAI